jgi:drug/metabolite transporter (DMT)-like permease
MELSFYRWFFVLVLLLPYLILHYKNIFRVLKKEYIIVIVFAALGIAGFNTFLYYGLQTTTAMNALLINSSIPMIIIVLSAFILKTKITKLQSLGIVFSSIGVIYLVLRGDIQTIFTLEFTRGDFWILLACITWALYTVLLRYKPKELNAFEFLSITTFIGVLILYIVFILQGYSFSFEFRKDSDILYSLIYMVIFPSILSFYFWNVSIIEIGPNKAGQFTHLMPIFGAVLAYIFLGEVLELYHFIGMTLIFIGLYLSLILYKRFI